MLEEQQPLESSSNKKYISLIIFIVIIGALGSLSYLPILGSKGEWYLALNKPGYAPPNWLFSILWPILYVINAVAVWIVWRARKQHPIWKAMLFFALQLLVSLTWSELFFGLQNAFLGFIWIVILWFLVAATCGLFWAVHRGAAALIIPYWLWVSYTIVLVGHVWMLNF